MRTEVINSSERLNLFLEANHLHKKDFAEMIGVTLSYVYSLIDQNVAFSTRTTTLERIAVVMGTEPSSFPEYRPPDEPRLLDPGIQFIKARQNGQELSNVHFFKRFPRSQRVELVDMWRGALPLPLDWAQLNTIVQVLSIRKDEIYPFWQARLQQHLQVGGLDPLSNMGLYNAMFQSIRHFLKV